MDADTWTKIYRDTGNGKIFNTGSCTEWHFIIRISNGQTVNDLTFYPMLRNAITYAEDDAYEPYTTDDLQAQINALAEDSGWIRMMISSGNGELYYRKYGKMVELKGSISPNGSDEWNVCTLPGGYRPSTTSVDVTVIGNSPRNLSISTQGIITVSGVVAHELIKVHACFLVD
ncbi:MAG: hypothetical protein K2H01_04115 [Ruminococcus sp.]|nr:hypothetical protein [Ruminococcus sp.]